MSKNTTPKWLLSADWGVSSDPFNWILYERRGERWIAKGFYPSVESLLRSLYQKLIRTEPADSDLVRHVEAISRRVQACAAALSNQINAVQWDNRNICPAPREVQ